MFGIFKGYVSLATKFMQDFIWLNIHVYCMETISHTLTVRFHTETKKRLSVCQQISYIQQHKPSQTDVPSVAKVWIYY